MLVMERCSSTAWEFSACLPTKGVGTDQSVSHDEVVALPSRNVLLRDEYLSRPVISCSYPRLHNFASRAALILMTSSQASLECSLAFLGSES
jgi:hypothetical protein